MVRTITAMFDDRAHADAAVEQLTRELNIDPSSVQVHAADTTAASGTVSQDTGFWASLKNIFVADEDRPTYAEGVRRGSVVLSAQVEDAMLDHAMDVLEQHGAVDLDTREAAWRQEGWTGSAAVPAGTTVAASTTDTGLGVAATGAAVTSGAPASMGVKTAQVGGEEAIPIVEESLRVGKRDVDRGRVRVRSYVVETPVNEQITLRQEHVDVQRRVVDRPVTAADAVFEERTFEATESAEEAVIAKEAHVTGEVVIRKDVNERTETVKDTVRRTEVEVDDTTSKVSPPDGKVDVIGTTDANPPGTVASRAADKTLGTNISGANPGKP
jgi:uncharacterized protein (TIGR02271 family)